MARSRLAIWLCVALAPGLAPRLASAGDWPQFRGPESAGVAKSAVPSEWGTDKNVEWKVKIPGLGWSSPIIWGDKVFVTTATTENQSKPSGGFGRGGGMGGGGMRGGRGRFGGPPQPGPILPPFLQGRLELTDEQKKQVDALQKEVDARLAALLTDVQKKALKEPPEDGGGRRGRFFGPPQPGQILPASIVERLKLTGDQKKQLGEFQKAEKAADSGLTTVDVKIGGDVQTLSIAKKDATLAANARKLKSGDLVYCRTTTDDKGTWLVELKQAPPGTKLPVAKPKKETTASKAADK